MTLKSPFEQIQSRCEQGGADASEEGDDGHGRQERTDQDDVDHASDDPKNDPYIVR